MMINDSKKMKEILADKDFVKELMALKDNAAVQAALREKGMELTEEQIQTIRNLQDKVQSGEIPDEMLDQVSGGFVGGFLLILNLMDKMNDDDSSETIIHEGGVSGGW